MKNEINEFLKHRETLIYLYNIGDLSKAEYIEESYRYIQQMRTEPFKRIDNMKKGIFNYQYYNVIAKYFQRKAHAPNQSASRKQRMEEIALSFYASKDRTSLKILEMLNFEGVSAYVVKVKSTKLKGKLFEIVFDDYEDVVLHSIDENLREILIREKVFQENIKLSVIDCYINKKY